LLLVDCCFFKLEFLLAAPVTVIAALLLMLLLLLMLQLFAALHGCMHCFQCDTLLAVAACLLLSLSLQLLLADCSCFF